MAGLIRKVHHVAYRCKDAKATVEWYGKYLGMDFILAIAEDAVPSTGEADPYMHVFLDAGGGNIRASQSLTIDFHDRIRIDGLTIRRLETTDINLCLKIAKTLFAESLHVENDRLRSKIGIAEQPRQPTPVTFKKLGSTFMRQVQDQS